MYKYIVILVVLFTCCKSILSQEGATEVITVYSISANDSFDVRFDVFKHPKGSETFDKIVFYFDAGLKAGKAVQGFFADTANENTLLVGIAHKGYFREKRRRDLMSENENMNQLFDSLIVPYVKKHYGWSSERIIIGHSFGGLWAYRDFFKGDSLFTSFIAISPSLWVEGTKMPNEYKLNKDEASKLYVYWGGNEELNYVKGACKKADKQIQTDNLLRDNIKTHELNGETHNTTPLPALKLYFK